MSLQNSRAGFDSSATRMKKIDLHKTYHVDAKEKVIRFVEDNWGSGEEAEIITGNSRVMKNIVISVLNEYKLRHQEGHTWDFVNKGYIVTWFE